MPDEPRRTRIDMEDDAEYRRQLSLFTNCCTEKPTELVKIGEVLAGLKQRRRFLDIGAGSGYLTIPISEEFAETTVVEPNTIQAAYLRRRCPGFNVYQGGWQDADLGDRRFDFILCSHVLYYIEEGRWPETIEKMLDHLEPGGCAVIVLQSSTGEVADFFNQFTRYDVSVLELRQALVKHCGDDNVETHYFTNEICTESLDDMTSIGLFLLIDRRFKEREADIRRYIEAKHRTSGGSRMVQDEILLAVKKPER
jgi:SAM-dependent methyltransferase